MLVQVAETCRWCFEQTARGRTLRDARNLKSAVNDRTKVKVLMFVDFDYRPPATNEPRSNRAAASSGLYAFAGAPRKLDNVFQIA